MLGNQTHPTRQASRVGECLTGDGRQGVVVSSPIGSPTWRPTTFCGGECLTREGGKAFEVPSRLSSATQEKGQRWLPRPAQTHGIKWRLAPALVRLVAQLDRAVPHRDRVSDGSIASHQHHLTNPRSDHEPHHFQDGEFVTAIDVTHNTKEGIYCPYLWDSLLKSEDKRHQVCDIQPAHLQRPEVRLPHNRCTDGGERGTPAPTTAPAPHTHHIHISIWGDTATDTSDWQLPEHLTFGGRQAHMEDLTAAAKTSEVEQAVLEMLGKGADTHSLGYALRFYRELAGRIGFDGSKPERVANWVYGHINSLQVAVGELKGEQ